MPAAAIFASIAGAVISSAASYAISSGSQPNYPNMTASSAALANAQAQALPQELQLQAAEQEGLNLSHPAPGAGGQVTLYNGSWVPSAQVPKAALSNAALAGTPLPTKMLPSTATVGPNFTGEGTADILGIQASKNAQNQLALEQKFSQPYIAEALKEEQLANPQGAAARDLQNQLIQQQISKPIQYPVANKLQQQVTEQMQAAQNNQLTPEEQAQLDSASAAASSARGGPATASTADANPLLQGFAGEARQQAAAQEGMGYLSSGETPEDIQYRQQQQNMANLSSLVTGATPESEFASIGGANGPVPYTTAQPAIQMPNSGLQGAQNAITGTGLQIGQSLGQTNNWLAGLTGALNIGASLAKNSAVPSAGATP